MNSDTDSHPASNPEHEGLILEQIDSANRAACEAVVADRIVEAVSPDPF